MIGKILKSAGMEALTLTRSSEAPEIIKAGKLDMVFLDLHRPSPDGIELARQMRSSRFNHMTPHCPDQRRPASECAFRWIRGRGQLLFI
jgi:DNA-binding response OmpR family regulator